MNETGGIALGTLDFATLLGEIDKRLGDLEQTMTSPAVMTTGSPVVIYDPVTDTYESIVVTPPPSITGLTAVPGTYYEDIYVDVDWSAGAGPPIAAYFDVELASKAGAVYSLISEEVTGGTSYRFTALAPNQTYGVRITPVSNIGVRGTTSAWVDFTTAPDATIPPAVVGVSLSRGASSAVVLFTGLTAAQAPDVANGNGLYEIQIDTLNTFNSANLQVMRNTATVVAFEGIDSPAGYYARVAAIDASGNQGPWSSIAGPVTAGGILDSMVVAGLSAAKITVGSMSGDRITANTLDVSSIKSSSITTAAITLNGGSLKAGSPPTTGVLFNSQGIRGYAAGAVSFALDATTGAATFAGTISASFISGSSLFFTGGIIDDTNGVAFYISPIGYSPQRALSFLKNVSPWTNYWSIWAPNASELYIQRTTVDPGDYQWLSLASQRTYFKDHSGNNIGYFYENGGGINNGLSVSGFFSATSKSFVIENPADDTKTLQHGCLEGPEFGVFYRGMATVQSGQAVIELPYYFQSLVYEDGATVQLTSIGEDFNDLTCSRVVDGKFTVYGPSGAEFFWLVHAERRDIDKMTVEFDSAELAGADAFFAFGGAAPDQ